MTPETALNDLRRRFVPAGDPNNIWRLMRQNDRGEYHGDCEDFAIRLAYDLGGGTWCGFWRDLIRGRTRIWYALDRWNGGGHAVLWHEGAGWADNLIPHWNETCGHRLVRRYSAAGVMMKFLRGAWRTLALKLGF
ncbi:hypothetical protein QO034_06625 [Sedimentitalea sp. JM2-8]|uniref:Transglutaminase-like domain-containing protein n=1 Tax=Sedimentitalea xiamensis TaxID=3050037 RepID=A0ABT7FD88_9RHOB|nr:hypothetical protein [Sedimentitalea xiamensis]MDK3072779.1 hypothetical protein [Sedimentitalea xiamensis]